MNKNCNHCNKPSSNICSKCKFVKYCSKQCQINDWKDHEYFCKRIDELRQMEKMRVNKKKFTNEELDVLIKNFFSLTAEEKNTYVDVQMSLLTDDLLPIFDICLLFERLDMIERYSEVLTILCKYPQLIIQHYEGTGDDFPYNIKNKWDWNLENKPPLKATDWRADLESILYVDTKLTRLISKKLGIEIRAL